MRCSGQLPQETAAKCERRNTCARYLDQTPGPMAWSACADGDAYVHVPTVAELVKAANPYTATPVRVM